jgi:hypothetical protein
MLDVASAAVCCFPVHGIMNHTNKRDVVGRLADRVSSVYQRALLTYVIIHE